MSIKLTENAIPAINNGDVDAKPLVQILGITLLVSSDDSLLRKYHLKLSDGVSSHPATIDAQLNDGVGTGRVKEGSIVQLLDYFCPTIVTKKYVISVINSLYSCYDCFYFNFVAFVNEM